MKQGLVCLLATLSLACTAAAQERRAVGCPAAALVNSLRGAATLRQGGREEKLTRKNALGKPLRAGDQLQVGPGTSLVIMFCGSRELKEVTQRPPRWYTVPNVPQDKLDPLFAGYADRRPLGRGRGQSAEGVFSPPGGGVARPESFVVRWKLERVASPVTLTLLVDKNDKVLWERPGVDVMSGRYTSKQLRDSLSSVRARNPETSLRLELTAPRDVSYSTVFHLLSAEDEASLAGELKEADRAKGFLRYLRRAAAFTRRQLYLDAAQEYEGALSSSSESVDLVLATIVAQCRAGNTARAATLFHRLPPGHPSRDKDCHTAFPVQ